MKDNDIDYLEGNTALAKDILTLLDLVKFNVESKVNMTTLDNTIYYNNDNIDKDDDDSSLAVALLQALAAAEYGDIKSKLINESNINKDIVPSHYIMMTNYRPMIKFFCLGQEDTTTTTTTTTTTITSTTVDIVTRLDSVIESARDKRKIWM